VTQPESALEQLVADATWRSDWEEVLARAGVNQHRRLLTRRRVVVAVAVAAAVIIPLAAVAAANDWWFFRTPGAPTPTSAPDVVETGVWHGHPWQLVAYPSTTDGLCIAMIPGTGGTDDSSGSAMGCGTLEGIPRTAQTKPGAPDMKITYLSGSATTALPAYIVGPVIEEATTVAIRLRDGTTIHTPTVIGPGRLAHVRFYAVQLPSNLDGTPPATPPLQAIGVRWIAGLDRSGRVVACLAPAISTNGISPLSECS
jgi:hypothetical protein